MSRRNDLSISSLIDNTESVSPPPPTSQSPSIVSPERRSYPDILTIASLSPLNSHQSNLKSLINEQPVAASPVLIEIEDEDPPPLVPSIISSIIPKIASPPQDHTTTHNVPADPYQTMDLVKPTTAITLSSIMNDDRAVSLTNSPTPDVSKPAVPEEPTDKKKPAKPKKTYTKRAKPEGAEGTEKPKKRQKKEKDPNGTGVIKTKTTTKSKKKQEKEASQSAALIPKPTVNLPPPTLLDIVDSPSMANDANKDSIGDVGPPIIALNIPLCDKDAPPGAAQVVFNVMKMAEDKYGWKTMHPGAKFAMDLIDDYEDDDMEDDSIEEIEGEAGKLNRQLINENKAIENANEAERKKRAQMNRKVGKYDYGDPFIDDSELLWEEEAAATKDGFFVYWGPLIEEGQHARIERSDGSVVKRGKGGKGGPGKKSQSALGPNGQPVERKKPGPKPGAKAAAAAAAAAAALLNTNGNNDISQSTSIQPAEKIPATAISTEANPPSLFQKQQPAQ